MSNNLWNEYSNIRRFTTLPKNEQSRIINLLKTKDAASSYYAGTLITMIQKHLSDKDYFDIAYNYIVNGKNFSVRSYNVQDIFSEAYRINPKKISNAIKESNIIQLNKLILMCNNITVEEEVKGLRALSTSKYIPYKIHDVKYKPRLDALKQLPPIMRLKAIESLLNNKKFRYNIFEHIPEDEFRALLFTSSLKYSDRIQAVYNEYQEIKYIGIESTVKVSGYCKICEEYSIIIKSRVIRTLTGINQTGIGRYITHRSCCPFCYSNLEQPPTFEEIK